MHKKLVKIVQHIFCCDFTDYLLTEITTSFINRFSFPAIFYNCLSTSQTFHILDASRNFQLFGNTIDKNCVANIQNFCPEYSPIFNQLKNQHQ